MTEKDMIDALSSARSHVYRQQHHGKHEQDRADAVEWISKYGTIDIEVTDGHPCNCVECTSLRTKVRKEKDNANI